MRKPSLPRLLSSLVLSIVMASLLGSGALLQAATPGAGAVDTTTTQASWNGKFYDAAANVAGQVLADPCPAAATDSGDLVCDHYTLSVNIDPAFWSDKLGGLRIAITWASASSDNDFDLYVYKSGVRVARSTQGGTTSEEVVIPDASGTYEVRVAPFTIVSSGYAGLAEVVARPIAAAPGAGPAAYRGVFVGGDNPDAAPQSTSTSFKKRDIPLLQFVDTGFEAAEPTVGVDKNGAAFYAAATFDGVLGTAHTKLIRSTDGGRTWVAKQPTIANLLDSHPETLDPYTYVEEGTGRVFDIDLVGDNLVVGLPLGADLSFSDDKGETWTTTALTIPGLDDHQTLFAGPPPAGNPAVRALDPRFPEILYYCVNQVSDSWCARSLDGGLTFVQGATPAYLGEDPDAGGLCGGLHGHLATDSAGRLFLPKGHCDFPWLAVSEDGGDTWTRVRISDKIPAADVQTAVAVDAADNVYYTWWDGKHHLPFLSVSRDHGQTWSTPLMIGPPGVREVNFPTIAAGDAGKITLTFPGTTVDDRSDPSRPWNSYVVVSTNALEVFNGAAGPTFFSNIANTSGDPVHRGACLGRCGGMFDFLDVVVSPAGGEVWATAVDTCTSLNNCSTDPKGASTDMRGIAIREISGPVLIGTPECPGKSNKCKR